MKRRSSSSFMAVLCSGAAFSAFVAMAAPAAAQSGDTVQAPADQAGQPAQVDGAEQSAPDALGNPPVAAQGPTASPISGEVPRDIVVTGTLIRGTAPTGQQLNVVTSEDIAQLGAANPSQVLASIPQDANFNNRPSVGGSGPYQTVNAPRLRYLGNGTASSNSTLLLLDGARLPGMGVNQTSSDIDAVPLGAIQRIDIATDGGSATYGADAVGGVVNLITRRRFDGLEVNGHYGGAADYRQYDVGGTVGKTWSNGSIWASYQFSHNDLLRNADRDYVRALDYTQTPPVGASISCNPGNFTTSSLVLTPTPPGYAFVSQVYPVVNGVPAITANPVANRCDLSRGGTLFPGLDRHSAAAGLNVDLSDAVTFDVKAFYTHRSTISNGGVNYYAGVPVTFNGQDGTASGNFGPTFGDSLIARTKLSSWAIVPRVTLKLGGDWQVVTFLNVGEGNSQFEAPVTGGDATALADAVASGAFNPFTGVFADNAAGQAARNYQANYYSLSSGRDEISNVRSVLDGPLFSLPGGQLRAALGLEYFDERFTARTGNALRENFASIPRNSVSRNVKSAFGELSVPVVGEDNRFGGIYSLTLSAAGRYDDYSDFGDTFNPKFGASLKPIQSWTIRGNWGKSFQAPSLAATAEAVPPAVVSIPAVAFGGNPAFPNTTGKSILLLFPGGGLNLRPQKATTWEVGSDFKPSFIPGLSISGTYYNIDFNDQIAFPAFFLPTFYTLYPNSYVMNDGSLTSAQIAEYIAPAYNKSQVTQFVNDPGSVYALENGLNQNLSATKTTGIDFNVAYEHTTGFGSLFGSVAGTYILTYKTKATPTSPFQGIDLNGTIRLQMSTSLGATVGGLLAKGTWNHQSSYPVPASTANAFQSQVKAFDLFNLAFQYAVGDEGALKGLSLNLNIDNVLNEDPPLLNGSSGYAGFTLGRAFTLGISKKF